MDNVSKAQLKRHEGLKLKPYRCTSGKLTIGWGRNLEDRGISIEEASILLYNDIRNAEEGLKKSLSSWNRLPGKVQGVLINMAVNLGLPGLLGFKKTLIYIENGDYTKAAEEMLNSRWAVQVGYRAEELAKIIKDI